jgi:hypothetical protein
MLNDNSIIEEGIPDHHDTSGNLSNKRKRIAFNTGNSYFNSTLLFIIYI